MSRTTYDLLGQLADAATSLLPAALPPPPSLAARLASTLPSALPSKLSSSSSNPLSIADPMLPLHDHPTAKDSDSDSMEIDSDSISPPGLNTATSGSAEAAKTLSHILSISKKSPERGTMEVEKTGKTQDNGKDKPSNSVNKTQLAAKKPKHKKMNGKPKINKEDSDLHYKSVLIDEQGQFKLANVGLLQRCTDEARNRILMLAQNKNPGAMLDAATCHRFGYFTSSKPNIEEAYRYLLATSNSNSLEHNRVAKFILSEYFYQNSCEASKALSQPERVAKSFIYAKEAAESGLALAQIDLGLFYEKNEGISEAEIINAKSKGESEQTYRQRKAFEWYEKAAKQNRVEAQYYLAHCFYDPLFYVPEKYNTPEQRKKQMIYWATQAKNNKTKRMDTTERNFKSHAIQLLKALEAKHTMLPLTTIAAPSLSAPAQSAETISKTELVELIKVQEKEKSLQQEMIAQLDVITVDQDSQIQRLLSISAALEQGNSVSEKGSTPMSSLFECMQEMEAADHDIQAKQDSIHSKNIKLQEYHQEVQSLLNELLTQQQMILEKQKNITTMKSRMLSEKHKPEGLLFSDQSRSLSLSPSSASLPSKVTLDTGDTFDEFAEMPSQATLDRLAQQEFEKDIAGMDLDDLIKPMSPKLLNPPIITVTKARSVNHVGSKRTDR